MSLKWPLTCCRLDVTFLGLEYRTCLLELKCELTRVRPFSGRPCESRVLRAHPGRESQVPGMEVFPCPVAGSGTGDPVLPVGTRGLVPTGSSSVALVRSWGSPQALVPLGDRVCHQTGPAAVPGLTGLCVRTRQVLLLRMRRGEGFCC